MFLGQTKLISYINVYVFSMNINGWEAMIFIGLNAAIRCSSDMASMSTI